MAYKSCQTVNTLDLLALTISNWNILNFPSHVLTYFPSTGGVYMAKYT